VGWLDILVTCEKGLRIYNYCVFKGKKPVKGGSEKYRIDPIY
jgi:hypothetical protein